MPVHTKLLVPSCHPVGRNITSTCFWKSWGMKDQPDCHILLDRVSPLFLTPAFSQDFYLNFWILFSISVSTFASKLACTHTFFCYSYVTRWLKLVTPGWKSVCCFCSYIVHVTPTDLEIFIIVCNGLRIAVLLYKVQQYSQLLLWKLLNLIPK